MARLTLTRDWHVRFIELMPLGGGECARVAVDQLRVERRHAAPHRGGPRAARAAAATSPSDESRNFRLPGGAGVVGFISPVSEPYCGTCNRMRLTADGRFHLCLLKRRRARRARRAARPAPATSAIAAILLRAVGAKPTGHELQLRHLDPRALDAPPRRLTPGLRARRRRPLKPVSPMSNLSHDEAQTPVRRRPDRFARRCAPCSAAHVADAPAIPFARDVATAARESGCMLVYRPATLPDGDADHACGLAKLCSGRGDGFVAFAGEDPWFVDDATVNADTVEAGWALVAKEPWRETLNQVYERADAALRAPRRRRCRGAAAARPRSRSTCSPTRPRAARVCSPTAGTGRRRNRTTAVSSTWAASATAGLDVLSYSKAVKHGALGICPTLVGHRARLSSRSSAPGRSDSTPRTTPASAASTTVVLESLPLVGGQIATFYPDTTDPRRRGISRASPGASWSSGCYAQASAFPITLHLGEEVVARRRATGDAFALTTLAPTQPRPSPARRSACVRSWSRPASAASRRSASPTRAIAAFEGRGLCLLPAARGRGARRARARPRRLGASDRGRRRARATRRARCTLVHRRDRLPVADEVRARARRLAGALPAVPRAGRHRRDPTTSSRRRCSIDATGGARPCPLASSCPASASTPTRARSARFGARLEGDAILVDSRMASDQPGIYAAGDGATYPGKVRVLAADFGEACTAVNNIAAADPARSAPVPGLQLAPQGLAAPSALSAVVERHGHRSLGRARMLRFPFA